MDTLASPRIWLDASLSEPWVTEFAGGQAAIFSQRCPDLSAANEDAVALLPAGPQQGVIVLADGCGGMAQGEVAARLAIEAIQQEILAYEGRATTLRPAILDGFDSANAQVCELSGGAATTVAILEIDGVQIRPYHVGDSAILLVSNRGRIKLQTTCHSPVGYAVQAGVLDPDEAIYHADRHIISNFLGTPEAHIEVGVRHEMSQRDTVVVASDGLFDNLYLGEIADVVRKGPLGDAAQRLAELALQRMACLEEGWPSKPDDLTFALYRRS